MATPTQMERFDHLVRSFETAMLVTRDERGRMRARPMSLASADAEGDLWFSTGVHSGKASEVLGDPDVAVVMQRSDQFVSVTGTAEVVVDREKARALWSEAWRAWFPDGPEDRELVLIHVHSKEAEFWDISGLRGFIYLFDAVRHVVQGERMGDEPDGGHHDRLSFPPEDGRARRPLQPHAPKWSAWALSQLQWVAKRARLRFG
jgi:general stress protein 26